MADHRAEQIIVALVSRVTGLTTTGTRVYRSRHYPLQTSELPGLCVYMGDDEPIDSTSYSLIDSAFVVSIEAHVKATSGIDTTLNQIRKEVVIAIQANPTLGLAFVIDTLEGRASKPEITGEGEQPIAMQRLDFLVKYRRSRLDPSA